ncbi:uncharacterized protein CIMG_11114 [Coccidioides immitis RS]|uniref:Uncharacterized protein n=2 Tax=Coccidioides TaxID=5500 RepID=A0A0D8JWH4_COCIM|nr:uncharacterized protein CIMG_11114 [Coccidioides immitis RS]EFW20716.1 conserved hypothetical protein [Coccidioides posadasii str. Silveira]KJF61494.1 hypothetical protein CIMG_11114 [Coccidioides immitis RS]QVM08266.1 hypothetical protein D8B26_002959 [Coccidioides posadasii str. Silveira]TPX19513.1 hypothetical protein DIZ76_017305 [Coccidioides immitis]
MPPRTRPIEKFAQAAAQCSTEVRDSPDLSLVSEVQRINFDPKATVYGKCVLADYNSITKDMCKKEFIKLKDCYLAAMKKLK